MPWYIYSILSSLFFAGMILCARYLGNKGFSSKQILLFLFALAFLGFFVLNYKSLDNIASSEKFLLFLIIMLVAGVASVVGNLANFTAIIKSPNPEFVEAIKNSNILLISFLSISLFGSPLASFKILGQILIIIGVYLLISGQNNTVKQNTVNQSSKWYVLAITGAVGFTIMVLGVKEAIRIGFLPIQINLFIFGFNLLAFTMLTAKEIKGYLISNNQLRAFLPIAFLMTVFSFLGNILNVKGISLAPNPGYHESIKNTQALLVTLLSVPFFGVTIDNIKLLGVLITLTGSIILLI